MSPFNYEETAYVLKMQRRRRTGERENALEGETPD
jgi:hypothetical protein